MAEQVIDSASKPLSNRLIARFAWGLLGYNLLVILWGVYVRATGSGAGCGGHWPTCNGVIVPLSAQMNTLIEYTHRVTSGLTLILSVVFVIWAWRVTSKGDLSRLFSGLVLAFTLTEALIGAGLVLFGLVASNDSAARAVVISLHLVNTLLLIGSLALAAWHLSFGISPLRKITGPGPHAKLRRFAFLLAISLVGMLILSVTGTIAALEDTLFPVSTLAEGLKQDFSPLSSFLLRLRVIHPILAVTFVSYSAALVFWIRSHFEGAKLHNLATFLLGLMLCQMAFGAVNVLLMAPVWLQIVHLLTADLVWIVLVLFTALFITS
jgi:heme a synthase